jgi:cytochrome P450
LKKLSYTDCVYKEVLRLWPPIPEIARLVDKQIQINGYDIPVGTWLMVSTYTSARIEDYFENPTQFMPERFSASENHK